MKKLYFWYRLFLIVLGFSAGIFLLVLLILQYEKNQELAEELNQQVKALQHLQTVAEAKIDEPPAPLIVDWHGQDGYTNVSLLSLLTNPRAYDGQKVCVDAYYLTDGYEDSELCLGERKIPGQCLHLSVPRYVDLTPWHGKYICVRGTFRGGNSLHTCILMYESMEPSRVKNPEETLESMRSRHDKNRRGTPPKGIPLP